MNRLELVRARVDAVLAAMPDPTARQAAAVHLYGVSQACAMLAMRRGADAECAAAAGMLHDIATYATGCAAEHGPRGAVMAREILISIGAFTAGEIGEICTAIAVHSDTPVIAQYGRLDLTTGNMAFYTTPGYAE